MKNPVLDKDGELTDYGKELLDHFSVSTLTPIGTIKPLSVSKILNMVEKDLIKSFDTTGLTVGDKELMEMCVQCTLKIINYNRNK